MQNQANFVVFEPPKWYNNRMKKIEASYVKAQIEKLITECLIRPDESVTSALANIKTDNETESLAAALIVENNKIAANKRMYCCQDTGQAVFFVKLGDEVFCPGLATAIDEATRTAYGSARKSVADPFTRINTGDNTPAIIETELVPGDTLEISFLAKGAGSENMSRLYMLTPASGIDGVIDCVVDAVEKGGRNACPPLVVGVGIGGVTETACMLSKRALLRPVGEHNARADIAKIEEQISKRVNALGIGVAALGGKLTALGVHIETAPTHIGMLPVAVNLQCHSLRHGTIVF